MRAAIYAKTAVADAKEIERQKFELLAFAQEQDWLIHGVYVDDGIGPKDPRLGLDGLLNACKFHKVDVVLVTRLDRLTRNHVCLANLLVQFEAYGVRIMATHPLWRGLNGLRVPIFAGDIDIIIRSLPQPPSKYCLPKKLI